MRGVRKSSETFLHNLLITIEAIHNGSKNDTGQILDDGFEVGELGDARFVRRDGGALHADAVLLDRVGGVDRHLVVGGVAVLHAQVVIVQIEIQEREDQLVLDHLPDDAGHFVAVDVDDGVFDLDLGHA